MSSNVIEFPTRAVRDWVVMERTIQEIMQEGGGSTEMIKEVCGRMKETWEKYNTQFGFALELPQLPPVLARAINDSVQKAIKDLVDQIHEYTSKIFYDRLLLEIELYKLRH